MSGSQWLSTFRSKIAKTVNDWKPVVVYFPVENNTKTVNDWKPVIVYFGVENSQDGE
jgi:hypothetical protein